MDIIQNYNNIKKKVEEIAKACRRDASSIKIIAVSKNFPAEVVQKAIDGGIFLFGENRVQEAKNKIPLLKGNFSFHMIGHLQSNKSKYAVKLFDCIHSIDKFSTCETVNNEAKKINKIQDILIQVNTSGESSKSGIHPDNLSELYEQILTLQNINCTGLMTIGPLTDDKKRIRESFKMLRDLRDEINSKFTKKINELSMGMSADFDIAIEEGATYIRIGTAIFGERRY